MIKRVLIICFVTVIGLLFCLLVQAMRGNG